MGSGMGSWKSRDFRVCAPYNEWSYVGVDFQNKRVDGKSAYWIHN